MFVRTTGCPLRCQYCDTAYAFSGGERMTLDAILAKVDSHGVRHVTVTGGEPLAQPATLTLMRRLCDAGYQVSLETSGALDIAAVDPRVMQVVDIKTPASKEEARNLWSNLAHLRAGDQLKFVLCDRADYEWSRAKLAGMKLAPGVEVLFSPSFETLPAARWPSRSWLTASACACRCSCTRCCGAMSRDAEIRAVVLLSGGLDSATVLAKARADGRICYALSVDYGQRHHAELAAAARLAVQLGALEHHMVTVDFGQFGSSALT